MERGLAVQTLAPWRLTDYVTLTKPRIILLLVVTAYCAMVAAEGGWPGWMLTVDTLGGLTLSIGAAHAINMWFDRDIDQLMERTRRRPVASGRLAPEEALSFGIFLETASFMWLTWSVNSWTAAASLAGFLFYVLVYTVWLKRRTTQNIVIGGAAGAFPPLVGWAAVNPHLGWAPWLMFVIIFLWTPPHFWALALYKQEDYRRANIPMLPVVKGRSVTTRQMAVYALLLIPASLALYAVDPALGTLYLASAVILDLLFGAAVWTLWRQWSPMTPERVFASSLFYMAGLFGSMVLGTLWH
jgi:protoheme IX farnesyltransferase